MQTQFNERHGGGTWRMAAAMGLSGTIGWFVLASGQTALNVVWMRCLVGGLALLAWLGVRGGWRPMGRAATAWLLGSRSILFIIFYAAAITGVLVWMVHFFATPPDSVFRLFG